MKVTTTCHLAAFLLITSYLLINTFSARLVRYMQDLGKILQVLQEKSLQYLHIFCKTVLFSMVGGQPCHSPPGSVTDLAIYK